MNTLASVILSALQDTRDGGYTIEERAEAIAAVVRVENATLRARLAACERVVEAACEWEKRYGWQHDVAYSFAQKELAAAVDSYRAAVAAETQTTPHAGGTDA